MSVPWGRMDGWSKEEEREIVDNDLQFVGVPHKGFI